jgi:hypothetical protein
MKLQLTLFFGIIISTSISAHMQAAPANQQSDAGSSWMNAMAERHQSLNESNGPGTDVVLGKRLLTMRERDQLVRQPLMQNPVFGVQHELIAKMSAIDAELTNELKLLLRKRVGLHSLW